MHSHVKYLNILFIGLIFTMMTGCVDNVPSDKIGVLVTIVPQIEMVDFIGGDYVDITVMVPKGQSPHRCGVGAPVSQLHWVQHHRVKSIA